MFCAEIVQLSSKFLDIRGQLYFMMSVDDFTKKGSTWIYPLEQTMDKTS